MAWLKTLRDALFEDDAALAKSYGLSVEDLRISLSDQAILDKITANDGKSQYVID